MDKFKDFITNNKDALLLYGKAIGISALFILITYAALGIKNNLSKQNAFPASTELIPKTGDRSLIGSPVYGLLEYEIKPGDSPRKIWRERVVGYSYKAATQLIINENHLKNINNIKTGLTIKLPLRMDSSCLKYIVKKGDTLEGLAYKFYGNINLAEGVKLIYEKNGRENVSQLEPGQTLLIKPN